MLWSDGLSGHSQPIEVGCNRSRMKWSWLLSKGIWTYSGHLLSLSDHLPTLKIIIAIQFFPPVSTVKAFKGGHLLATAQLYRGKTLPNIHSDFSPKMDMTKSTPVELPPLCHCGHPTTGRPVKQQLLLCCCCAPNLSGWPAGHFPRGQRTGSRWAAE